MKKWVCTICGYVHEGPEPPDICPVCGAPKDKFVERVEKEPAKKAETVTSEPVVDVTVSEENSDDIGNLNVNLQFECRRPGTYQIRIALSKK